MGPLDQISHYSSQDSSPCSQVGVWSSLPPFSPFHLSLSWLSGLSSPFVTTLLPFDQSGNRFVLMVQIMRSSPHEGGRQQLSIWQWTLGLTQRTHFLLQLHKVQVACFGITFWGLIAFSLGADCNILQKNMEMCLCLLEWDQWYWA